jgi:hypothetical protein
MAMASMASAGVAASMSTSARVVQGEALEVAVKALSFENPSTLVTEVAGGDAGAGSVAGGAMGVRGESSMASTRKREKGG